MQLGLGQTRPLIAMLLARAASVVATSDRFTASNRAPAGTMSTSRYRSPHCRQKLTKRTPPIDRSPSPGMLPARLPRRVARVSTPRWARPAPESRRVCHGWRRSCSPSRLRAKLINHSSLLHSNPYSYSFTCTRINSRTP